MEQFRDAAKHRAIFSRLASLDQIEPHTEVVLLMWRAALCVRGTQAVGKIGLLQRYGAT